MPKTTIRPAIPYINAAEVINVISVVDLPR